MASDIEQAYFVLAEKEEQQNQTKAPFLFSFIKLFHVAAAAFLCSFCLSSPKKHGPPFFGFTVTVKKIIGRAERVCYRQRSNIKMMSRCGYTLEYMALSK